MVSFLPEGVTPLYEDPEAGAVLSCLPEMDERGLAQLPPPPPPGGDGGRAQEPGGGGFARARGDAPESSQGGTKRPRAVSPILVDSSSASPTPSLLPPLSLLRPSWGKRLPRSGQRSSPRGGGGHPYRAPCMSLKEHLGL